MVREAEQSFLKLTKRRILEKLGRGEVENSWSKWSNELAPEDTLSEAEIGEFLKSEVYKAVNKVYKDHFKGAKYKAAKKLRMRKPKVNIMRNFRIFLKTLDESTDIIDKVLKKAPARLPDQFSSFAEYIKNWLKGGNIRDRYNEEYLWFKRAFAHGGGPTSFSKFGSPPQIDSRFRGFISCRNNEPPTKMELDEGLFKRSSRKIGYFKGVTTGPLRSSRPWERRIKNINGADAYKEVLSFLAFYDFLRKMAAYNLRLEEDVDELSEEIRRVIGGLERMDWEEMDTLLKGAHKKIKNGIEKGYKASDFFEIIEGGLPGPVFGVLRELNHRERELQGQRRISGERMEKIEKRIKKAKFLIGEIIFVARPMNEYAKGYLKEGGEAFEDYGYDNSIEDYAKLIEHNIPQNWGWNRHKIKTYLKNHNLGGVNLAGVPRFYPPNNLSPQDLIDRSQEVLNEFIQKIKL